MLENLKSVDQVGTAVARRWTRMNIQEIAKTRKGENAKRRHVVYGREIPTSGFAFSLFRASAMPWTRARRAGVDACAAGVAGKGVGRAFWKI
jgi:hypothetical protein